MHIDVCSQPSTPHKFADLPVQPVANQQPARQPNMAPWDVVVRGACYCVLIRFFGCMHAVRYFWHYYFNSSMELVDCMQNCDSVCCLYAMQRRGSNEWIRVYSCSELHVPVFGCRSGPVDKISSWLGSCMYLCLQRQV